MTLSAFPYPGGKTPYVNRILEYFPAHQNYIEVFGGGAALLLNKPESYVEVYNDANGDVVHFFRTVRDQREDLEEWLRATPYSRDVYDEWAEAYFNDGYRPDNDVERAGRWFYLRYTNYGGKVAGRAGFKAPGKRNEARSLRGGIDALDDVVDRLQEVTIENEDFADVIDRYDRESALFYLDPPYVEAGDDLYGVEFDHERLADSLADTDGKWIVSYDTIPDALADHAVAYASFDANYSLAYTLEDGRKEDTELLAFNFDPDQATAFIDDEEQQTFADLAATDGGVGE